MQRNCEKRSREQSTLDSVRVTLLQKCPSPLLCLALQHLCAPQTVQWVTRGRMKVWWSPATPSSSRSLWDSHQSSQARAFPQPLGEVRTCAWKSTKENRQRDPVGFMSEHQNPVPQLPGAGWASVPVIGREIQTKTQAPATCSAEKLVKGLCHSNGPVNSREWGISPHCTRAVWGEQAPENTWILSLCHCLHKGGRHLHLAPVPSLWNIFLQVVFEKKKRQQ